MSPDKPNWPYHPFLFALCPVLFLYVHNLDQAVPAGAGLGLAAFLMLAAMAVGLCRWFLKDSQRAAFLATMWLILFASYGHAFSLMYGAAMSHAPEFRAEGAYKNRVHLILSAFYSLMLLVAVISLRVRRIDLRKLTGFLNLASAACLTVGVVHLGWGLAARSEPKGIPMAQTASHQRLSYKPDIYYIILDGYARADILKEHYNLDNRPFLQALEQRGFYIAPFSYANYWWTFLSLSSSLNLTYLDEVPGQASSDNDRRIPYRMIRKSLAANYLRKQGYRFIHLNSTWGATMTGVDADLVLGSESLGFQDEFLRALAQTTWLSLIESYIGSDLARCRLQQFEHLKQVSTAKGPKFVMAHFLSPHHPYLFDRNGKILRNATVRDQFQFQENLWAQEDKYIDQLLFVNQKVLEAIDRILSKSEQPPVIILQSDHGPWLHRIKGKGLVRARFANLAAFHLPGADAEVLMGPAITPVNEFRQIFRYYFGADFEVLTNRHFSSSYNHALKFDKQEISTLSPASATNYESTAGAAH
jgi:hypothetical protein